VKGSDNFIILLSGTLYLIIASIGLQISKEFRSQPTQQITTPVLIFEKDEGWGPCPPEGEPCKLVTKLYSNGMLTREGQYNETVYLSEDEVNKIVNKIEETNVLQKSCDAEIVLDYYAFYKIKIKNIIKDFIFPGCEREMKEIEELLPPPTQELQGGA
jgi:hypothetical protein